ncbi:MAG TPA: hypothetical protein VF897_21180, partial [Roseiflexaceae bacterium]
MDQPLAHRIAPHWIRTLLSLALAGPLLATLMASPALARERGPDIMRQNISSATSEAAAPQIALGAGRMVAIWAEHDSRFGYTSTRPGDGWPKAEVLRTHALTRFQWPAVAVDGAGTVHLAYAANDRVYYQSQSASGEWSGLVQVGMSRQANTTRIVRALDGTLWIVWRDRDGTALFYRYSLDGGRSWHAGEDQGVVAVEPGNMIYPSIALGYDNLLHIVWYVRSGGPNQGEIRYADWTGTHFNVGRVTTDGSEHYDAEPAIVIDPQNVQHVVWRKGYANHWDIRYARRMPGRGWQDFTTIATTKADYKYPPSVATDELGNLFVSYAEPLGRDGQRIALRYKLGDGAWQSLALSTGHWDSRTSVIASIVTGSIEAHVVYQHQISGGGS